MPNVPNNTLQTVAIRSGISRNDGTNGLGTPSLAGQIVVNTTFGPTNDVDELPTQEMDDSPIFEWAEQCTVTHRYKGSYDNCIGIGAIYQRGTLVTDDFNNYYRVLSATAQYGGGGGANSLLTIVCESVSFDVPPDQFNIRPVKLGLDIMKHPRYYYNLMPTNQMPNYTGINDTNAQIVAKQAIIRAIQAYRENPFIPTTNNINNMVGLLHDTVMTNFCSGTFTVTLSNPNFNSALPATPQDPIGKLYSGSPYPPAATSGSPTPNPATYCLSFNTSLSDPNNKVTLALAAAQELIGKLWRMEDSPLINGVEMEHTEFWFRPPPLNLGGYIEDPFGNNPQTGIKTASPVVPDYFYSTSNPPNQNFSDSIFAALSTFNPQCYATNGQFNGPVSISWLRDADVMEFDRTWFRVTRKWLGAPVGCWDMDIYAAILSAFPGNRPNQVNEYRNLLLTN